MHNDVMIEEDPQDQPGDADNRRQLKNFVNKSRYQLRYINWYITGAFMIMVTTVGLIHYRLQAVDGLLNADADAAGAGSAMGSHVPIYDAFTDITTFALAGFVLFVIYACVLAVIINHRVAGPSIALVDCIEQMRNGNYDYNRRLRKNDELGHIHEALQDLNSALRRRSQDQDT